jgi:transposase-like protein
VSTATPSYKGHRYPVEIINHCVWLYFSKCLEMVTMRGSIAMGGVPMPVRVVVP